MTKKETYVTPTIKVICTPVNKSILTTFSMDGNVADYSGEEYDDF